MQLIPVLDLRGGRAVHARGGDRSRYAPLISRAAPDAASGDAVAIAAAFAALGARRIYVADLDAIEGRAPQESLVRECARAGLDHGGAQIWLDAGIARSADAARWGSVPGVERIIVGLESVAGMDVVADVVRVVRPLRVAFSLDLRNGAPQARSTTLAREAPLALQQAAVRAGASAVLLLDLARVGSGAGVDEALAGRMVARAGPAELIVGGGVGDLDAVRRLAVLGVHGVLIGSALHDGRIDPRLLAAFAASPAPA